MGWLLSFGQDRRWRRATVRAIEASPSDRILDVATGTGLMAAELVRRYDCSVVGFDQSEEMLARARRRLAREQHLGKADRACPWRGRKPSVRGRGVRRPDDGLSVPVRGQSRSDDPRAGPGRNGREAGLLAWSSVFLRSRRRVVSGASTPSSASPLPDASFREAGTTSGGFYPESIPQYYERYPLAAQQAFWKDAGIRSIEVRPMSFGAGLVMWGTRDSEPS